MAGLTVDAGPYPSLRSVRGGTGLCLFSAAFLGVQDAVHMARAGLELDLVDIDDARLEELAPLYPLARLHPQDAWEFAGEAKEQGKTWDVVSTDTWTGDIMRRSLDSLELWCSLASFMVTATHTDGTSYVLPDGWTDELMYRSDLANWLVLTRD